MPALRTFAVLLVTLHPLAAASASADDSAAVEKEPSPKPAATKSLRVTPAIDAPFRARLETKIPIEFIDVPLNEVVDFLSSAGKLPILIDKRAFEEEGIPLDEPINHVAPDVPIVTVLERILEPLGLTWIVKGDAIVITSAVVAEEVENLERATYDVRSLLENLKGGAEPSDVLASERSYPATNVGFGCAFGDCVERPGDDLIDLVIRLMGYPETWADQGGPGDVALRDGRLVVRTTQSVHREIDALLSTMNAIAQTDPGDAFVRLLESPAEKRIRDAYAKEVSVEFVDTPLRVAIDFLMDTTEIPILIDVIALEEEGIPLDEPITLNLKAKPLRSVLVHMLGPLGLETLVKRDALLVTSKIVGEELGNLDVVVVDARDLAEKDLDELADTIVRLVEEPQRWADQGGSGEVIAVEGILFVRQTQPGIREIESMLAELRRNRTPVARKPRPAAEDVLLLDYTLVQHDPEEIVDLIQTFAPDSSKTGENTIKVVGQQLFIRTTLENHRAIHELLSKLNGLSALGGGGLSGNFGLGLGG